MVQFATGARGPHPCASSLASRPLMRGADARRWDPGFEPPNPASLVPPPANSLPMRAKSVLPRTRSHALRPRVFYWKGRPPLPPQAAMTNGLTKHVLDKHFTYPLMHPPSSPWDESDKLSYHPGLAHPFPRHRHRSCHRCRPPFPTHRSSCARASRLSVASLPRPPAYSSLSSICTA